MGEWIVLSRTQHADRWYLPRQGYRFAAGELVAPVLNAELGKLLGQYVLGFVAQDQGYLPVALLGVDGANNLYLHDDGRWLGSYVPAAVRAHPFRLGQPRGGEQALCLDSEHLCEPETGQPLFDQDGNLAEPVQQTLKFLTECEKNRRATQAATHALNEAGLIEPWPLQVARGEDLSPVQVQGLYRVNEQALNALTDEAFVSLRPYGALALAYAQRFSMNHLEQLAERTRFQARQAATAEPAEDIATLLDRIDNGTVSFNFDD